MASSPSWSEFNGTSGSQVETPNRSDIDWKSIDDSTTSRSAAPVAQGANSFTKYQCVKLAGSWASLSAFHYNFDVVSGTGWSLHGAVVSAYATPSASASGDGALSAGVNINANFNTATTPFGAGTSTFGASGTSSTPPLYIQALRSQLQSTGSAAAGDTSLCTNTATWTES